MRRATTIALTAVAAVAGACGTSGPEPSTAATTTVPPSPESASATTSLAPATTIAASTTNVTVAADAPPTAGLELGETYAGPLAFAWPTDCSVPVTGGFARYGRDGSLLEGASFEVRLTLDGGSDRITVTPEEFAITAPEDASDARRATLGRQLRPPTFVVDGRGAVIEVSGLGLSNALFDGDGESTMSSVELDLLDHHYRTWVWGPWVGMWAAFGAIEPEDMIGNSELDGHPPERFADDVWEPPPARNGVVLTSASVREAGVAHLFAHVDLELESADPLSRIEALQQPDLSDAGVSVSAQIDPTTLRPSGLIVRRTFFADSEFGILESRDDLWEFDWLASDCDR